jgi:hydroxymethylpyrimidine/phosphomethylpyrimidine kinase
VQAVAPDLIRRTLQELTGDFTLAAVRIGMLGSGGVAEVVAEYLEQTRPPNVVLDPVFGSSSGADLLDAPGRDVVRNQLIPLADVITPNAAEASALTGLAVETPAQMEPAAARLHEAGARAIVLTGGDWAEPADLLSVRQGSGSRHELFRSPRIDSSSTHGTGCAFATAIAANLALGKGLREAVMGARDYVRAAIEHAQKLGHGTGPVNHLFRFKV